jgi:hypothetical protein
MHCIKKSSRNNPSPFHGEGKGWGLLFYFCSTIGGTTGGITGIGGTLAISLN